MTIPNINIKNTDIHFYVVLPIVDYPISNTETLYIYLNRAIDIKYIGISIYTTTI